MTPIIVGVGIQPVGVQRTKTMKDNGLAISPPVAHLSGLLTLIILTTLLLCFSQLTFQGDRFQMRRLQMRAFVMLHCV